ncbi:MAG: type I-D CRISPR-associated protein Cas5/Csc1 [Candidatus Jettenia sp. CY-1]|nr:type I-D CRISPR-associated protein Cas5/Csc1 [Candidatus Jettenia sp.]WKZ19609.1 MAG: type I-D CRISPR-associated protein Cas5/Csc1 [Candidatus Jettenia sp. CY-1]
MEIYPYTIKLIDPLFYSHEALSGAYTTAYLHATAVNHAVAWSMGRMREDQSYIISEEKGGRNIPRYNHSWIEPDFYFTPASPKGSVNYLVEIVKGDMDYLIQHGFGQAKILGKNIGRNEVLKAYRIFSIPPETEFNGYLHADPEIISRMPAYIRLGSFRGKAILTIGKKITTSGIISDQYVNHPVDPLVSKVIRGVMIGMFPYPIVDNAFAEYAYEIKNHGRREFIALPAREVHFDKDALLKRLSELKPGLTKVKDVALPLKDKAYIIVHMLRTALSVRYFLMGIPGEERLNSALKGLEWFNELRLASKGEYVPIENKVFLGYIERIEEIIHGCEEKIKGAAKSGDTENSGESSSSLIL